MNNAENASMRKRATSRGQRVQQAINQSKNYSSKDFTRKRKTPIHERGFQINYYKGPKYSQEKKVKKLPSQRSHRDTSSKIKRPEFMV